MSPISPDDFAHIGVFAARQRRPFGRRAGPISRTARLITAKRRALIARDIASFAVVYGAILWLLFGGVS